jgi:superfamily I DNA and/or RNA helicase
MLNVAVTRAKKRLYVIGNLSDWASCRYFDEMAKMLAVVEFDARKGVRL